MSDTALLSTFIFSLSVTTPIFLMVALGTLLRRLGMIDEAFINTASRLVFNVGLPVLLFIGSATTDYGAAADARILLAVLGATLLIFTLSLFSAGHFVRDRRDRGVLVQAAFRGNLVIVGLAYCSNAYGESGVAMAALPIAMTILLYNVLSVYVLNRDLESGRGFHGLFRGLARNPLILGIGAGLLYGSLNLPLADPVRKAGSYLGNMSLPLALLCVGGSLKLSSLRELGGGALVASGWKLLLCPLIAVGLAVWLGLSGEALGVVFLLSAAPTATVSYVMVRGLGGNAQLAANMVVQSTLFGLVTVTLGLWLLQAIFQ